jgi:inhibitor of KinA
MVNPLNNEFQISPLGDNAIVVTFGNEISVELNNLVIESDSIINARSFTGFVETVPAYSSISVFYDPLKINSEAVKDILDEMLANLSGVHRTESRTIEIPVSFAPADAPDLELLASEKGLKQEQVIEIFTAKTYRVYMLGFLPGFSYMGEVDERIATERKASPRTKVAKGSIGIAGNQTGIYSLESPGGWQIIGRTSVEMFLPDGDPPAFLRPGDTVKFVRM